MQAECTVADTFTVPYFGFVVLRVRSDNPGIWLFHCHMDYHLAAGTPPPRQLAPAPVNSVTPAGGSPVIAISIVEIVSLPSQRLALG